MANPARLSRFAVTLIGGIVTLSGIFTPARAEDLADINVLLDRMETAYLNRDVVALADSLHDPPNRGKGNLAAVAVRSRFNTPDGKPHRVTTPHLYVRYNQQWLFLADLPIANVDIGTDPSLPQP